MTQHDTLTQALQQIADWNSHTTEYAVDYGSNGVRDFYRSIARAALSATQPAQAAQPVSRDVIRDVFLRNGFTIKDGCSDLKPYVYAAANALLEVAAAQPVQGVPEDFVRIPRPAFDKAASALRQYSQAALSKADQEAAIALAQRMARTAGKCRPSIMVHASYMLLQCAAMVGQPDAYIDWKIKMEAKK